MYWKFLRFIGTKYLCRVLCLRYVFLLVIVSVLLLLKHGLTEESHEDARVSLPENSLVQTVASPMWRSRIRRKCRKKKFGLIIYGYRSLI